MSIYEALAEFGFEKKTSATHQPNQGVRFTFLSALLKCIWALFYSKNPRPDDGGSGRSEPRGRRGADLGVGGICQQQARASHRRGRHELESVERIALFLERPNLYLSPLHLFFKHHINELEITCHRISDYSHRRIFDFVHDTGFK
jgi:hypothetical protein